MKVFELMMPHGHEEVVFCHDRASGLRAIVAIHNTSLGPALGGTRMFPYDSEEEALTDVLRLAQAMTYKAAVAELDLGGGKAVIIGDPAKDKSEALLRAYGRFTESLGGRYITTTDVGTTTADMDTIRRETRFVTGCSAAFGGSGDTSILTAVTVHQGMQAAVKEAFGADSLRGMRVAVQGLGKVGWHLLEHLARDGCVIYASERNAQVLARATEQYNVEPVPPNEIYDIECDIFAPNALGAVLNDDTIPRLRCRIVCGGANNQLAESHHAQELARRNILYAPDFVVNAGGLINVANELLGYNAQRADAQARAVYATTLRVFALARAQGITPAEAANRLAEERIAAISAIRHFCVPGPSRTQPLVPGTS